jgi:hypothetical protein
MIYGIIDADALAPLGAIVLFNRFDGMIGKMVARMQAQDLGEKVFKGAAFLSLLSSLWLLSLLSFLSLLSSFQRSTATPSSERSEDAFIEE